MSPTMEQGGITKWKVKEGAEFASGDVLLEIETDKAQIDVDAADDGVLAKIIKPDGAKDIPVGATIAYIADVGDDLSKAEFPDPADAASKPTETASEQEPEKTPSSPAQGVQIEGAKADAKQTLLPSVLGLLAEMHLSPEEALNKIPASGPHGRLLKGDVLAYMGKIPADYPEKLRESIDSLSHLDLSNIK
ncbi:hypothetical protein CANCADRAFT_20355, partial [Tortispora caseinolytica NRRL Y-17796]